MRRGWRSRRPRSPGGRSVRRGRALRAQHGPRNTQLLWDAPLLDLIHALLATTFSYGIDS